MPPEPKAREEEARLSGARAEFAASLPRRLETLRGALAAAEQQSDDADRVKSLLRRVHAVGSAARVLGFASVAEALAEAERSVRQATGSGKPARFDEVSRAFDVIPSLVLGAAVSVRGPEAAAAAPAWPTSVLLLGSQALADAVAEPDRVPPVECERLNDASRLVELVHIVGPDVIVVDGDHEGARDAVGKLFADELIEPTPVVVVGSFAQPDAAAAFVELGVSRVLPKPCSPDTLRRTVEELRERALRPRAAREPLGELNMAGLAERIAQEFKRGLVDALEAGAPNARVPLGEGHDVLAAVWGAVARVRELVTVRSSGNLRFQQTGPEGGVPIAPWALCERRAGERAGGKSRGTDGVSLQGRRIVVADDDPAVVWFMAGLLRAVGVEVLEAHDGRRALELAFEHWPDAVVSDVLMPKLDGFSLCHEIKRDVALRDVPVILLSWKEDLLQRVRELGALADGYLRKEAAASAVVERVREVLRARARVEERIVTGGEVRGRLDGLTPRLVLELACRGERDARVSVRDAAFLFEAQIRKGRLVSLTRSAANGSFARGAPVVASLLGASAGRFSVEPDASSCRVELSGSLVDIVREPIEKARGALRTVTADALLRLERVELDRELLEAYLACTPEPAALVTRRLLQGEAPRDLVFSGAVSAQLLEVVLSDIARRGGLLSAITAPASESSRPPAELRSAPPDASDRADSVRPITSGGAGDRSDSAPATTPGLGGETPLYAAGSELGTTQAPLAGPAATLRVEGDGGDLPFNAELTPGTNNESEPMLSFGSDAKTLDGVGVAAVTIALDTGVAARADAEADELGASVLGLFGEPEAEVGAADELLPKPASDAPDGVSQLHAGESAGQTPALQTSVAEGQPKTEALGANPSALANEEPIPRAETLEPDTSPALPAAKRRDTPRAPKPPEAEPAGDAKAGAAAAGEASRTAQARTGKSSPSATADEAPKKGSALKLLIRSVAACGAAFFITTWFVVPLFSSDKEEAPAAKPAVPVAAEPSPAPAASASLGVEDRELPRGMEVAPGQGILEIETSGPDPIYVDDAFVGVGPVRRVAAAAGSHSVEVRGDKPAGPIKLMLVSGRRAHVTNSGPGSTAPAASSR
jgi:DNA-binding response OmpR family regulator